MTTQLKLFRKVLRSTFYLLRIKHDSIALYDSITVLIIEDSHCRNCKALILSQAVLNKALAELHKILSSNKNLKELQIQR